MSPIHTSKQMAHSIKTLTHYMQNDEWKVVVQALAPEVHQLVTGWNTLSSYKKGELTGYVVGKYGMDIVIPGALTKAISQGVKGTRQLVSIGKNLPLAQETLILEKVGGSSTRIDVIALDGRMKMIANEEWRFSVHEIAPLSQVRPLETNVAHSFANIVKAQARYDSFELFDKAKTFLKPYSKGFLPEVQARELIHQTGIKTFPRPVGIPENFRVRLSDKGAGMEYVHPEHTHTSVRVMPGQPHSSFPNQQTPYIIYKRDGQIFDKFGNVVKSNSPEAHISIEEFSFKEMQYGNVK